MKIYKDKKELVNAIIEVEDVVLDVGFWGQGKLASDSDSPHSLLLKKAAEVHGLDIQFDRDVYNDGNRYHKLSAENFDFNKKFSVITALDLIEHLSNPGLFLYSCSASLKKGGRLVITTPNAFNLFNLFEKISKDEPTVNPDHTFYFNKKTLEVLLVKNGWEVERISYLYDLGCDYKESWKKKISNVIYKILAYFTPKFIETIVVEAKLKNQND